MHHPDECKQALCLLRGTRGGFFKTSHASEARASSSSVQGACDGAAEKAEALDRLPAKRAPMLVLPSLSASRAQLWAY
jgi:hypothetical protein